MLAVPAPADEESELAATKRTRLNSAAVPFSPATSVPAPAAQLEAEPAAGVSCTTPGLVLTGTPANDSRQRVLILAPLQDPGLLEVAVHLNLVVS